MFQIPKYLDFLEERTGMVKHLTFEMRMSPPCNYRSSPPEVLLGKGFSEDVHQIYRRTPMPKHDFSKVALQLY